MTQFRRKCTQKCILLSLYVFAWSTRIVGFSILPTFWSNVRIQNDVIRKCLDKCQRRLSQWMLNMILQGTLYIYILRNNRQHKMSNSIANKMSSEVTSDLLTNMMSEEMPEYIQIRCHKICPIDSQNTFCHGSHQHVLSIQTMPWVVHNWSCTSYVRVY